jgi:hypothetical protein
MNLLTYIERRSVWVVDEFFRTQRPHENELHAIQYRFPRTSVEEGPNFAKEAISIVGRYQYIDFINHYY